MSSYHQGGVQENPVGGRGGRGNYRGRGRGRGQGRGRFNQGYNPGYNQGYHQGYNGNHGQNFQYQNTRPHNFVPKIPKEFYDYLMENINATKPGSDDFKYPVLNMHSTYVIRKFKLNSIITKELLGNINPGDDQGKTYHFKRTYCSPNRIMNDGLFFELQRFINDIK